MKQYGTVVAHDGETATVTVRRHASCEKCGACGLGNTSDMEVTVRDEIGASVGDSVIIELEFGAVFMASAIVYAIPLVLLVLGFLVGPVVARHLELEASEDVVAVVLGFAMLITAFAGIHIYDRRARPQRYMPRITTILGRHGRPDEASW